MICSLPAGKADVSFAAAAGSLARMGNESGRSIAEKLAVSENPVLRAQAAWVLGWFKDEATLATLSDLVNDPEQMVQVAAAAAVVRRANPAGRG